MDLELIKNGLTNTLNKHHLVWYAGLEWRCKGSGCGWVGFNEKDRTDANKVIREHQEHVSDQLIAALAFMSDLAGLNGP